MAKGPESKFTAEMNKSFSHQDCAFYLRIEDDPFNAATAHTRKKPFDALAFHDNYKYAFEYKAERSKRWNLKLLAEHQIEGLLKAEKHGFTPCIILNFRGNSKNIRAFNIYLSQYLEWLKQDKKSISIEELENHQYCRELKRIKLEEKIYGWDVKESFF